MLVFKILVALFLTAGLTSLFINGLNEKDKYAARFGLAGAAGGVLWFVAPLAGLLGGEGLQVSFALSGTMLLGASIWRAFPFIGDALGSASDFAWHQGVERVWVFAWNTSHRVSRWLNRTANNLRDTLRQQDEPENYDLFARLDETTAPTQPCYQQRGNSGVYGPPTSA